MDGKANLDAPNPEETECVEVNGGDELSEVPNEPTLFDYDQDRNIRLSIENQREVSETLTLNTNYPISPFPGFSDAFKPRILRLGPVHMGLGSRGFAAMEAHKRRFLCSVLDRTDRAATVTLRDLRALVRGIEREARDFYIQSYENIRSDHFVDMMLLDGSFLLNVLHLYHRSCQGERINDPIFTNPRILSTLRRDLLLHENQLPMVVLEELYSRMPFQAHKLPLSALALKFFEPLRPDSLAVEPPPGDIQLPNCRHILALFHLSFLRTYAPQTREPRLNTNAVIKEIQDLRCLVEAGVRLKNNPDATHLLDVRFKGMMTLKVPTLFIDKNSNIVLRNLIVHEQSCMDSPTYFTSLVLFYSSMIKRARDIEVLKQANILKHGPFISNNDILKLIKTLSAEITDVQPGDFYLEEPITSLNNYIGTPLCKAVKIWRRVSVYELLKLFLLPRGASLRSFVTELKESEE